MDDAGDIKNDSDVQWYRLIKDTGTTEMVDPQGRNIHFTTTPTTNDTALTTTLTITNATKSYTGYYWVRILPYDDVCNVSLTITTGTYVICRPIHFMQ